MHSTSYQHIMWLVVLVSSLWVLADAKAIGVKKGQIRGLGNLGPWGWFFACLLLWFPAFLIYLYKRPAFKRINAAGLAPSLVTVVAGQAPQGGVGTGMNGTQSLVWGVVLIVLGLGLAGWGGWRSYEDVAAWQQAWTQLKQLEALTPNRLAQLKQEASQSQDLASQFLGSMLSPELVEIGKQKAQSEADDANARMMTDLPLLLFGLAAIYFGNGLLGRTRKSG
jgi:hypothetical protein